MILILISFIMIIVLKKSGIEDVCYTSVTLVIVDKARGSLTDSGRIKSSLVTGFGCIVGDWSTFCN